MHDLEALRSLIAQWNANRLDLFSLSDPNEDLEFHGVMRFYFQDSGQRVATKCIRVSSTATTKAVVDTLIEKFRPDMRMLSNNDYYALYEIHANGEERKLCDEEKPLLVQLNWHKDDREGRFLLRRIDESNKISPFTFQEPNRAFEDVNFKRKLSKREKKQLKKQEKLRRLQSNENDSSVAEKLYTEIPETSFTRSISNPEAVMRRRRQQKLEKKLQQFRSKDGGPDTGGTLKIYGESICKDVPYKTLLLSVRDTSAQVVKEMLDKYGLHKEDPANYCLIQQITSSNDVHPVQGLDPKLYSSEVKEYILDDDECPLAILMGHTSSKSTIMFHVRRKPADYQPRKRKKKPLKPIGETDGIPRYEEDVIDVTPHLYELNSDGSMIRNGTPRLHRLLPNVTEVGSEHPVQSGQYIQLYAPDIQARHCVLAYMEGIVTVTPSSKDAVTYVNGQRIYETTLLEHGAILKFGQLCCYQFIDSSSENKHRPRNEILKNIDLHSSKHNFETTFDVDGNIETISTASLKDEIRSQKSDRSSRYLERTFQGVSPILPAVMELLVENEDPFLDVIISNLDPQRVQFKLAPTYTLYMAARFRASTHFLPDLSPQERAARLTVMVAKAAAMIQQVIGEHRTTDAGILAFWMANASELLHFLKQDRHLDAYSSDAQDILAESVQMSFRYLFLALQDDMAKSLPGFFLDHDDLREEESHIGVILSLLSNTMALLRRCRVNAALTIQLFSQLFHFINMWLFNKLVLDPQDSYCSCLWGVRLKRRLDRIERWAEKQGLELAADCHLARIAQASYLLQSPKYSREDLHNLTTTCFKLNSVQVQALLNNYHYGIDEPQISPEFKEGAIKAARDSADELLLSDGRDVRLPENPDLQLPFLLPEDGYSCDIVRGVPGGLTDFLMPLQQAGLCKMTLQPASSGYWTIYMKNHFDGRGSAMRSASAMSVRSLTEPPKVQRPELMTIQLKKSNGGMGLSIVAAKGVGQPNLGIYIKSVVKGGAADLDGRLQSGDQLLTVDSQSLMGITQEKAAEILMRTGPIVTLEVAKQGAVFHGLATLLSQPSPVVSRGTVGAAGNRRSSERDIPTSVLRERNSEFIPPSNNRMTTSKSVPSLHSTHDETLRKPINETSSQKGLKSGSVHSLVTKSDDRSRSSQQNLNATHPMPQNLPSRHSKQDEKIIQEQYYQNISIYQKGATHPSSGSVPFLPLQSPAQLGRMDQHLTHSSQIIYPNPELNTSLRERPASAFSRYPQEPDTNLQMYNSGYSGSNHIPNSNAGGIRPYNDQIASNHYNPKSTNNRLQYYKTEEGAEIPPARPPLPKEVSQNSPPPPPPTTTHPLYLQREQERNERNRELSSSQKPYNVSSPWDREERERPLLPSQEQVRRQAAARAWRDQQIAALESIPNRSVKQEEQLHALRLEREFQKRVEEISKNEDEEIEFDDEGHRLVESDRNSLIKTVQDDLDRLEQQQLGELTAEYSDINRNKLTHPPNIAIKLEEAKRREMRKIQELEMTRQVEQRILREAQRRQEEDMRNSVNHHSGYTPGAVHEMTYTAKTVAVYPENQREDGTSIVTKLTSNNQIPYHHSSYTLPASSSAYSLHYPGSSVNNAQPPPPERSSSYNALSHFQNKSDNLAPKKTVSFGEDISHSQESPKNQNPEKFFSDAEAILANSPKTPENYSVNTSVTPGVIGAQEVYRDPRQRRLAAKQEEIDKQKIAGPEKLTFKEKMKMFAMESGEVESPKDKVKISRAQREIELNNTNVGSKLEASKS